MNYVNKVKLSWYQLLYTLEDMDKFKYVLQNLNLEQIYEA